MKKTVTISIAGTVFHIEEDAYGRLDEYLTSIRKHFSKPGEEEVISDIEVAIADRFTKRSDDGKRSIGIHDVSEMMEAMGSVKDIIGEDDGRDAGEQADRKKKGRRLYRDGEDPMVGGVAAGLGDYFGIDPTILRILFVITAFINGIGILAYIIFWISMPEAKTSAQKLAMKGESVTIAGIGEAAKEKQEEVKPRSGFLGVLDKFLEVIAKMMNVLAKAAGGIARALIAFIGVILTVSGIAGVVAAAFGLSVVFVGGGSPYIPPFNAVLSRPEYIIFAIAAFIAVIVPMTWIAKAGISLVKMKSVFSTKGIIAGAIIWAIALGTTVAMSTRLIPGYQKMIEDKVNAPTVIESREAADFNSVSASGSLKVKIVKGDQKGISISGTPEMIKDVKTDVSEDKLTVTRTDAWLRECWFCRAVYTPEVIVTITAPNLDSVHASDSSDVQVSGFSSEEMDIKASGSSDIIMTDINSGSLSILASGSSDIDVSGTVHDVIVTASGSSDVKVSGIKGDSAKITATGASDVSLTGETQHIDADIGGASKLSAFDLSSTDASLIVSGSSTAKVNVEKEIQASSNGSSEVLYKGSPEVKSLLTALPPGEGTDEIKRIEE